MDRYTQFGLRTDADEQFRRAFRDGFKRAGLSHAQLLEAMEWYRDHGHRQRRPRGRHRGAALSARPARQERNGPRFEIEFLNPGVEAFG